MVTVIIINAERKYAYTLRRWVNRKRSKWQVIDHDKLHRSLILVCGCVGAGETKPCNKLQAVFITSREADFIIAFRVLLLKRCFENEHF